MAQVSHVEGGVALSREEALRQQWAAEGFSEADIEQKLQAERDRQAAQDAAADATDPHWRVATQSGATGGSSFSGGRSGSTAGTLPETSTSRGTTGPLPGTPGGASTGASGGPAMVTLAEDPLWAQKQEAQLRARAEDARVEAMRLSRDAEGIGNQYSQDIRAVGTDASRTADVRAGMITDTGRLANASGLEAQGALTSVGGAAASTASTGASNIGKAATTGATSLAKAGETAASTAAAGGRTVTQASDTAVGGLTSSGRLAASQADLARQSLENVGLSAQQTASDLGVGVGRSGLAAERLANNAGSRVAPDQVGKLEAIEATEGPSAAEATLQSAINRAELSNLSLARSGRGWGGSASALSRAIDANAVMGQEASAEAARIRATEDAARRARAASNLVAGGQLTAQQRALNDATALEGLRQSQTAQIAGAQTALEGVTINAELARAAQDARIRGSELGLTAEQAAANARLAGATTAAELGVAGAGQRLAAEQAAADTRLTGATSAGQLDLAGRQVQLDAAKAAADARARGIETELAAGQAAAGTELSGLSLSADTAARAAEIAQTGIQTSGNLLQSGTQLGYQGDSLAAQTRQVEAQVAADNADRALQKYGIDKGVALQKSGQTMQMIGGALGAAATVAPFLLAASDRDAKEGIRPATNLRLTPGGDDDRYGLSGPRVALGAPGNPAGPGGPDYDRAMKAADDAKKKEALKERYGSALGAGLRSASQSLMATSVNPYAQHLISSSMPQGPAFASDRDVKENIEPASNLRLGASEAVSKAPGYSFRYKDPERNGDASEYEGDGEFYGVMAQDLEKTPVGRSTVKRAPDGTKMVDTSRLSLVNTAAIQELQEEVDRLKGRKSGTQTVGMSKRAPAPRAEEYDADYARAFEAAADAAYAPAPRSARDLAPGDAPAPVQSSRGPTYDVVLSSRARPNQMPTLAETVVARESAAPGEWDTLYPEPRMRMRPSALPGARVRRGSDVSFYEPRSNLSL